MEQLESSDYNSTSQLAATNIPEKEWEGLLMNAYFQDVYYSFRQKNNVLFKEIFKTFNSYFKKDGNCIIRYVIFLYDQNSPLRVHYPVIQDRKDIALKLAGFSRLGVRKKTQLEILHSNHEGLLKAIYDVLKYQNNTSWAMLVSNEETFWQLQEQINTPLQDLKSMKFPPKTDDSKKAELKAQAQKMNLALMQSKSKLMEEAESLATRIKKYESELYGEDDSIVQEVRVLRHKASSPEDMAS